MNRNRYVGLFLIMVAMLLGAIQDLRIFNIYGSGDYKWYFYSALIIILVAGIAVAVWPYKKNRLQATK